jgi:diguanylate cyclase (GGDEF)-like protein/PAS domain S-box-containing protein
MLIGHHSPLLVVVSILIAIFSAYTALDMASRITGSTGRARHGWLAAGATIMGFGIWSMHFIGMLAFSLPINVGYDAATTLLSLLIAIIMSAFGLWLVSREKLGWRRLLPGGVIFGLGVACMHYSGMEAMQMHASLHYDPLLFALSIVVAISASIIALWINHRLRDSARFVLLRMGAALFVGLAIAGMHYTGMAAAEFHAHPAPLGYEIENQIWLAPLIILSALASIVGLLVVSSLSRRHQLQKENLQSSLSAVNEVLSQQALHDSLTGLPNRRHFKSVILEKLELAKQDGHLFALLFIDLDGFKAINDIYGHHTGDSLLVDVARRLRAATRCRDFIARLGGDEFLVLLDVNSDDDAIRVANQLIKAISNPYHLEGSKLRVSASVGIAVYPQNGETRRALMVNADAAMYRAKSMGRNRYCFSDNALNDDMQSRLSLLRELDHAIENGQLILHYQPKYRAPSGPVMGVEALVRWNHPEHGMIPPNVFIPLAEKTGLIINLGEWVLNQACGQLRKWLDEGYTGWTMAVNLSALQLSHPDLIDHVRNNLEHYQLNASSLILEVTESVAMSDLEANLLVLDQLNALGVQISIDDFGTGHSSLLYLKRLPASELKIDKGFLRDLTYGSEDATIITSIIALARTFNMRVVAEGVETPEQQEFLTNMGCDSVQGFLFGRPTTAAELIAGLPKPALEAADPMDVDQRWSRASAHETYQILTQTLEQAVDSIIVIDESNRIILFNQSAEKLSGYLRREVLGQSIEMLIPQAPHGVEQVPLTGGDASHPLMGNSRKIPVLHKDGSLVWGEMSISRVQLGRRVLFTAFIRDISDKRRQEEQIQNLSLAVAHGESAVVVTTPEMEISYVNPVFPALFGYNEQDVIGKNALELLADLAPELSAISNLNGGTAWREDYSTQATLHNAQGNALLCSVDFHLDFTGPSKIEQQNPLSHLVIVIKQV